LAYFVQLIRMLMFYLEDWGAWVPCSPLATPQFPFRHTPRKHWEPHTTRQPMIHVARVPSLN